METETNKLLVSHNDLDGIAAVVIALLYGFDGDIYIAPNPQQIPEAELMKYDDITVTDLAPSDELMKSLISKGKAVRVYDHHSSAEHIRNRAKWMLRDVHVDYSSAGIVVEPGIHHLNADAAVRTDALVHCLAPVKVLKDAIGRAIQREAVPGLVSDYNVPDAYVGA